MLRLTGTREFIRLFGEISVDGRKESEFTDDAEAERGRPEGKARSTEMEVVSVVNDILLRIVSLLVRCW